MDDVIKRIQERLKSYPNLFKIFVNQIPEQPPMEASIYKDVDVERIWGKRFTFWNILLHDDDPQFKALLQELDALVASSMQDYGEELLRTGIKNDPFSFLSELTVYESFHSHGVQPMIEPSPSPMSTKKMDLSVDLDNRDIMIEVIAPHGPPGNLIKQGIGFAPWDLGLSKKLAYEIVHHMDVLIEPTHPTIIMVNGIYSGLNPENIQPSIDELQNLKETDFPDDPAELATLLAKKGKCFVSVVVLFKSNRGPCLAINPMGPRLSEKEISSLNDVFLVQS